MPYGVDLYCNPYIYVVYSLALVVFVINLGFKKMFFIGRSLIIVYIKYKNYSQNKREFYDVTTSVLVNY